MSLSVTYNVGTNYGTNSGTGTIQLAANNHVGFYTISAVVAGGKVIAIGTHTINSIVSTNVSEIGDNYQVYVNNGQHNANNNSINCTCNYGSEILCMYNFKYYTDVQIRLDYYGTASTKTGELWTKHYLDQYFW